ncbi:amylo-alpha-1,6-glucosidase [Herbiconiux sp. CPCC 205716]|uniref:Amylo-alpha-1,6-glucosidase n=1 Tax=Herbiconiux gentiana TaxID=2970912 RepID=A0ABT2GJG2_9MICO|nr:glycogen debranching N-terminal domain-containing protein [Herbiconiux gentiana]MCS5716364.1 amylo-alpha-1,6-glucosidase [Herbiconiux gentiana]
MTAVLPSPSTSQEIPAMPLPSQPVQPLQPFLNDATVVLAAPTQAWSAASGAMTESIHGVYHSDSRVVRGLALEVGGSAVETVSHSVVDASTTVFTALVRSIDDSSADPRVRLDLRRSVAPGGLAERLRFSSALGHEVVTEVRLTLVADGAPMQVVKAGLAGSGVDTAPDARAALPAVTAVTRDGAVLLAAGSWSARLDAPGAAIAVAAPGSAAAADAEAPDRASVADAEGPARAAVADAEGPARASVADPAARVTLTWPLVIPAHGTAMLTWALALDDRAAVVTGASGSPEWADASVDAGDSRLARWNRRALDDLTALRMETSRAPGEPFLAAGAPWFFTLFGRDSLWAARLLLPLGTELAASTLRVLAGLQGERTVGETAEQPGKIMHELRPGELRMPGEGITLPPLYYGTVDATALWVVLLAEARRWGLSDDEVRPLLPNLRRALEWMRDHGDSDGDGFLEYADTTGHGLANQGWKDSGDSVQWRDGRLAEGPIALCEVQGYAYQAAVEGAELLDAFGEPGGDEWRAWAAALADRFRASFWIEHDGGRYPAIALDAAKRPVDTLTSNIGHLLGTGILNADEAADVARLLVDERLDSGFGLRTMATDSAGFWPLSYHGGTVWAHDTAIAVQGLAREGFRAEAATLGRGLLRAAEAFGYRMPELHSGDSAAVVDVPAPYPAACRPQAWSAAAAVAVAVAATDARPAPDRRTLLVAPLADAALGHVTIDGLRVAGRPFRVDATPTSATATPHT